MFFYNWSLKVINGLKILRVHVAENSAANLSGVA